MKFLKIILPVFLFLFLAGCKDNVQTFKPMNVDLSEYETFAYLPNTDIEVPGKDYSTEEVNQIIIETVNQNMMEAGYTLDRDNPDLLVLISAETDLEVATERDPAYARYPYTVPETGDTISAEVYPVYTPYYYRGFTGYRGYDTDVYAFEEGTVIIDLIDRETKKTVWKGITSETIFDEPTTAAIAELVNDIFQEYPLK